MGGGDGISPFGPDNTIRQHVEATSQSGRNFWETASHGGQVLNGGLVLTLDVQKLAQSRDALQFLENLGADLVSVGVPLAANEWGAKNAARAVGFDNWRPNAAACKTNPKFAATCDTSDAGMPSSDSAFAAALAGDAFGNVYTNTKLREEHPWVLPTTLAVGVLGTLSTNYGRIAAGDHFFSQTMIGDAVGFSGGFLLRVAANHFFPSLSVRPSITPTSAMLSVGWTTD